MKVHTPDSADRARILADHERVRRELSNLLATLDDPTRLATLDTIAQNDPDAVNAALIENGVYL